MITEGTINEMVRIIRASKRMCEEHPDCNDCQARVINCEFVGNNDLEELIHIIDRYDRENAEQKQDDPKPKKSKDAQEIEGRLHELELYRMQMQLWAEQIVQRIERIEEHAAHQDRAIMCDCVHVDDTAEEEQPKKRTRMEAFLDLFPNARMSNSVHVPVVKPCETDERYMSMDCTHAKCYECMEEYWSEEVNG